MTPKQPIKLHWITEESDALNASNSLEKDGDIEGIDAWEPDADALEEFGDSQLEPMTIIIATVAAGWLIKRISDVMLDWKRPGGMLIDTTGDKVLLRPAPKAPRGTLVLVTDDSKRPQVIQPKDQEISLQELTKILAVANG